MNFRLTQMKPVAMPAPIAPRMPLYSPGAPGIGQQLFYGQATAMIPPQVTQGYKDSPGCLKYKIVDTDIICMECTGSAAYEATTCNYASIFGTWCFCL